MTQLSCKADKKVLKVAGVYYQCISQCFLQDYFVKNNNTCVSSCKIYYIDQNAVQNQKICVESC